MKLQFDFNQTQDVAGVGKIARPIQKRNGLEFALRAVKPALLTLALLITAIKIR